MRSKKLEKIIVATGLGRLSQDSQFEASILPEITKALSQITGQKPSNCPAKKSIAGFKIRAGNLVGLKVTLRGKRMNDFLFRMINIVLPRVRDFRGIDPKQIDEGGNLTIGFRDHNVFPEISPEDSKHNFGLQVTLVSGLKDKREAYEFFKKIGVPLKEQNK
ncbi:MAG: 50S ribosomal protein L5 [Candidatus Colwellbacteria bacterium CG10_big_fil_rev_8_21_14_0_10_42_22]|uniref:50S ribosomal protein L5 n=1 Tax=Candidatus Colwellbacteria bacterium CG10_big_fil_rev_8_21_14_0_10_42_22 TaxID=1974540 RepID=A0A2H0VF84_9BACT|nr:MAG: 50S ribosomal protein L5 [Candidatus Colwellbacteria bacterium CG10_big_fil_rev_8_21_14_0_10_42_22]